MSLNEHSTNPIAVRYGSNEEARGYLSLRKACEKTGLSVYFLRKGCKEGTVPHIMSGVKYLIDMRALSEMLERESSESVGGKRD